MRSPNTNVRKFWETHPISKTEILDANGFRTGEFETQYSTPKIIRLTIYPNAGNVVSRIFGLDYSPDQIAVSNYISLEIDSLLFLSEPVNNYATTYTYRVNKKQHLLHTMYYGLIGRT